MPEKKRENIYGPLRNLSLSGHGTAGEKHIKNHMATRVYTDIEQCVSGIRSWVGTD